MGNILTQEQYFKPGWDAAKLAAEVELWDASTSGQLARCLRNGEYSIIYGLRRKGEAYQLKAGSAVHAALAAYYSGVDPEACLVILAETWGQDADFRLPPGHRFAHLHLGHLEVVMKNYFQYAKRRDTFKPLTIHRDEIDLSKVVAGWWQLTEDGRVVLGESKFIIEFDLTLPDGKTVKFHYSGKPDLPILMGGVIGVMDHKSTSSWLSEYWGNQHAFSNQLRGYCAMGQVLTGQRIAGGLINGIYLGEKASTTEFKGSRFERYGMFSYTKAQLNEALLNQYFWRRQLDHCYDQGYFPQNPGRGCSSCDHQLLCAADPATRESVMLTEYVRSEKTAMDHFLAL